MLAAADDDDGDDHYFQKIKFRQLRAQNCFPHFKFEEYGRLSRNV
jgi:hypothetical protein